jgi:hypothetical protein
MGYFSFLWLRGESARIVDSSLAQCLGNNRDQLNIVFRDPVRHRPQNAEGGQSREKRNVAKNEEGDDQNHNAKPSVDAEQGRRHVDRTIGRRGHGLERLNPAHPLHS